MRVRRGVMAGLVVVGAAMLLRRRGGKVPTLPTVAHVDLERYGGRWFEVARLPLRWEAKCASDVTATYTLRPDGKMDVLNQCRKADGSLTQSHEWAKVVTGDGSNAKLKVTFFPPFFGDYWILDLDPEYRWAMVGTPNRKYLWVLCRTPQMDRDLLEKLLGRAKALGFVTIGMIYTKQS